MFRSSLFSRAILVIGALVLTNAAAFYLFSVPLIRKTTFEQESQAAQNILDGVYALVQAEYQNMEAYRLGALEAQQQELRAIVSLQESYIRSQYSAVLAGHVPEEQARSATLSNMRDFRFGTHGYVWVADYDSLMISHPEPAYHGRDFSELRDIHGVLVVPPLVQAAREHGEGFHQYAWPRLGEEEPEDKLAYGRDLPDREWVIGTGMYLDRIDTVVEARQETAVEELRELLRGITIADTGYMYIFDAGPFMLIHPSPALEGTNFGHLEDPRTGQPLAPELIHAAEEGDSHSYLWDHPDDPGNYVYEKISWVRHHEGFDWYIAASVYTEELRAGARTMRQRIFLVSAAVLVLSCLIGFLLLRHLLSPIAELSGVAARVRDGDLEARAGIERDDEIGLLSTVFDEMIGRLRDHIEHLDRKVTERTQEIADRNRALKASLAKLEAAQETLIESEQRAVEASRTKSAFLATMSHELRTPLNATIGYSEMLIEDAPDMECEEAVEDLTKIRDAGRRLLGIIDLILDISRLETGALEIVAEDFDLALVVRESVAFARPAAEKRDNELTLVDPGQLGVVTSDRARVRQVLDTLLSNACKFTQDGRITVEAARRGEGEEEQFELRVRDTGIGIAPDRLPELFEPFVQADSSSTREYGGVGLGLAIARRLCWLMGGSIEVESAPGVGSLFVVSLPVWISGENDPSAQAPEQSPG